MNTAKLTLFDTVVLTRTPSVTADRPARTQPQPLPASLWRQSLAAMDNAATGPAHRASQICFTLLGALSAGSIAVAAATLFRCLEHDGLHAAVQTLMNR